MSDYQERRKYNPNKAHKWKPCKSRIIFTLADINDERSEAKYERMNFATRMGMALNGDWLKARK